MTQRHLIVFLCESAQVSYNCSVATLLIAPNLLSVLPQICFMIFKCIVLYGHFVFGVIVDKEGSACALSIFCVVRALADEQPYVLQPVYVLIRDLIVIVLSKDGLHQENGMLEVRFAKIYLDLQLVPFLTELCLCSYIAWIPSRPGPLIIYNWMFVHVRRATAEIFDEIFCRVLWIWIFWSRSIDFELRLSLQKLHNVGCLVYSQLLPAYFFRLISRILFFYFHWVLADSSDPYFLATHGCIVYFVSAKALGHRLHEEKAWVVQIPRRLMLLQRVVTKKLHVTANENLRSSIVISFAILHENRHKALLSCKSDLELLLNYGVLICPLRNCQWHEAAVDECGGARVLVLDSHALKQKLRTYQDWLLLSLSLLHDELGAKCRSSKHTSCKRS